MRWAEDESGAVDVVREAALVGDCRFSNIYASTCVAVRFRYRGDIG